MSRLARFFLLSVFLLGLFSLSPSPAGAHGYIVRAIPENRAVLERPPTRLQYWFSEGLEPDFSGINLRNRSGEIIARGGVSETDNTLLTLRVPKDLPDGAYIVELRPAFASDGHVFAESRVFFVGEEIGGVAGFGATDQAIPLEVFWRMFALGSAILLFGASTLYTRVLIPAWGSAKYPAGLLPPRVLRRLNVIFGYALALAFAANLLALIQQTMTFFNIGFSQALNPDFWQIVRSGSRFGDIWNWRMAFLGGVGLMYLLSLFQRDSQPEAIRAYWAANSWLLALVLGSFSVLSHAAGSLLWPYPGILFDWFHILAVGFWVGGLVTLVLVAPLALRPYAGDSRRLALLAALRRFSPLATASLFIVISTGIYAASNWIFGADEVQTTFGGALIFKLVLVAGLAGLGATHHAALRPERYARLTALIQRVQSFLPSLRIEAFFALMTLGSVALLSATPVPIPEFAQNEAQAPNSAVTIGDYTVVMSVIPGGPGINTHDTVVTQDGVRVPDLTLTLMNTQPSTAYRGERHLLEPVEDGLYVTATDDIGQSGHWWSLVDLTLPDGTTERAAFEWDITPEASVIQTIDPNAANLAALMLVLLALSWVSYPLARRGFSALNLDAFSVSVAFAATVFTFISMGVGYALIQQGRDVYAEKLFPPAEVVNAVLPTQASLERGVALYQANCLAWQTQARDFNDLRDRLDDLRDDELYDILVNGWRNLSACGADLTLYERWDVVNYLRTLARGA